MLLRARRILSLRWRILSRNRRRGKSSARTGGERAALGQKDAIPSLTDPVPAPAAGRGPGPADAVLSRWTPSGRQRRGKGSTGTGGCCLCTGAPRPRSGGGERAAQSLVYTIPIPVDPVPRQENPFPSLANPVLSLANPFRSPTNPVPTPHIPSRDRQRGAGGAEPGGPCPSPRGAAAALPQHPKSPPRTDPVSLWGLLTGQKTFHGRAVTRLPPPFPLPRYAVFWGKRSPLGSFHPHR